jgi:hypothetical protein
VNKYQEVVFLDTNTLHYARLYLRFAIEKKLPPFKEREDSEIDTEIDKHWKGRTQEKIKKSKKLIRNLQRRNRKGDRIVYSPISYQELACGILKGKAIVDAAGQNTLRMWNRMDEDEIFERLLFCYYGESDEEIGGLETEFENADINLIQASRTSMYEVWIIARNLLKYVFLDVGDSIIYASALLELANELRTGDKYFRTIANGISNPKYYEKKDTKKYQHFDKTQKSLRKLLSETAKFNESDILFPKANEKWYEG